MSIELKPFLLSYRNTREDNHVEYSLVYAASVEQAKDKLGKKVASQPYGEIGAKCRALGITNHTIE
jgi:hypothetical protein